MAHQAVIRRENGCHLHRQSFLQHALTNCPAFYKWTIYISTLKWDSVHPQSPPLDHRVISSLLWKSQMKRQLN